MQTIKQSVCLDPGAAVPFHNGVDYCVGTGRMGLALQKEYQDQLALVQKEIGFSHIRGHGLFSDDMSIYQEYTDDDGAVQVEYNFTYLDLVMDSYREKGLRPFLELGFMPAKLASGTQTVFYWRGNVTPPKQYEGWCAMVQATLRHLMQRYGADEVVTWPVEVWNEPNLEVFWENASKDEYFKLFDATFAAVKAVDERFRVGGPAVCGGTDEEWITAFLTYCDKNAIPVDFITRHHYTIEPPDKIGHYGYAALADPEQGFANLHTTRTITDSFARYRGLPIHVTEFNTAYIPNCPLHDTNRNAAYIARQLSRLGDDNESYSYWTFGDIFEESGVPFTPFHGGFGLVANGCIPKPTFWTFRFFKLLMGGRCISRTDSSVTVLMPDGSVRGVAWNLCPETDPAVLALEYTLPAAGPRYCLLRQLVDETTANPLKCWHDMGEPSCPNEAQKAFLRAAAQPLATSEIPQVAGEQVHFVQTLSPNAVAYFELTPVTETPDRGYDYARVVRGEG